MRDGEILSILDLFGGDRGWTLLATPAQADSWRSAAATADVPVEFVCVGVDVQDPSGAWASLYGVEDGAVLVRPDGHVAWRTRRHVEDAGGALRRALVQILANS